MLLLTHIALALITVAFATYNMIRPSETKIRTTYVLTLGTILSAVALIFVNNVSIAHACFSGIIYVALVTASVVITKKRLSSVKA